MNTNMQIRFISHKHKYMCPFLSVTNKFSFSIEEYFFIQKLGYSYALISFYE